MPRSVNPKLSPNELERLEPVAGQAPNPLFELRPIPYVWLLFVRGEVMFCERCPGKCLSKHIDGGGVAAHACRYKRDLNRFGEHVQRAGQRFPFSKARKIVAEQAAVRHKGERAYLAVHEYVSGELTTTVIEVF